MVVPMESHSAWLLPRCCAIDARGLGCVCSGVALRCASSCLVYPSTRLTGRKQASAHYIRSEHASQLDKKYHSYTIIQSHAHFCAILEMPKSFELQSWTHPVPVTVADGLPIEVNEEVLLKFTAFDNWLRGLRENLVRQSNSAHTYHADPFRLQELKVHSVTMFGPKIGFMNIEVMLRKNNKPRELDRVVFLRGGSVAVLMILRPKDAWHERYVIMTEQPRVGACSTMFLEIPAGMLDDSKEVKGKAIQEIEEETHLKVLKEELIDLTALALEEADQTEELQAGIYMSPANLDEFIPLLLWEKKLERRQIEALKGRLTGLRAADEMITIRIVDYKDLWKKGARDSKTLAAWALYEGLTQSGRLKEKLDDIRLGRS
jgi:ADP-sugar diphosphatase